MKDINFFESYVEKRQLKFNRIWIYYAVIIALIILVLFSTIVDQIRIRSLSKDIAKLKAILEDDGLAKKRRDIENKEKEIDEYREYIKRLQILDEKIEERSIIDYYLLEEITSLTSDELFLTSISMYTDYLELIGISDNKWSIAEFGQGLETIEGLKDVFITSISKEEHFYNFTININLKEVNSDGEDGNVEED